MRASMHTHNFTAHSCEPAILSLLLFIKNLQSAADKAVDDSMLDSVFPMLPCAHGHLPNMCGAPASAAAALQALRRRSVAYTRYITNSINSAIAHLTGNKLWML